MCLGVEQSYNDNARLKIKTFYVRWLSSIRKHVPAGSVTLCYLPRINGSPLEINGSCIRPDSPAFVTLHRVVSANEVVFGSRERVRVSEGTSFEVYVGEDKLMKGIFRRDDVWKMDMKCVCDREIGVGETEVCVEVEGGEGAIIIREKVEVVMIRREKSPFMRRYNGLEISYCFRKLEEIPEQREGEYDDDHDCCSCSCSEIINDIEKEIGSEGGNEVDMDGMMRWVVDVGIWIMCLGTVGYFVTKASSKSRQRRKINV